MQPMHQFFPLSPDSTTTVIIEHIPAGPQRLFEGRISYNDSSTLYEGETWADIYSGKLVEIRLYLRKAGGAAEICLIIEGMPPPACADTLVTPPTPPPLGSTGEPRCYQVQSNWLTGRVQLNPWTYGGSQFYSDSGENLAITNWKQTQDSLFARLVPFSLPAAFSFDAYLFSDVSNGALPGQNLRLEPVDLSGWG
jgi:hypothetical protein